MIRIDHTPSPEPEEDLIVPVGDYRIQVVGSGLSPGIDHHQGDLLATEDGRMVIIDSSGIPREVRPHNYGNGFSSYQRPFESPFLTPITTTPGEPQLTVAEALQRWWNNIFSRRT